MHYTLHNLHVHFFLDHLFVLYDTLYVLGLNVSPNYSPQDTAVLVGHSNYLLLFLKEAVEKQIIPAIWNVTSIISKGASALE